MLGPEQQKLIEQLSARARQAVSQRAWPNVAQFARQILNLDSHCAEGWFLAGVAHKANRRFIQALEAFERCLVLEQSRYDAAIELANLKWQQAQHARAVELLDNYAGKLSSSPLYSHMAASVYSKLGLHKKALPLYQNAQSLQPDVERLLADLAGCAAKVGQIDEARQAYESLLVNAPTNQRYHYELSRLGMAKDEQHIEQMRSLIAANAADPESNVFLHYSIGKELEDLQAWDEAFAHYRAGGEGAGKGAYRAGYRVAQDVELMQTIATVCNKPWLERKQNPDRYAQTPLFVVGLPRTGTTLVERIMSNHSQVGTAGESFFMQMAIKAESELASSEQISPSMIQLAAKRPARSIAKRYLDAVSYRVSGQPFFVEKYPFNFLYLGFIAKAFPDSKIVYLNRSPLDACFAMFKQSYFKFAYTLDDLAQYYIAYHQLKQHWLQLLGDRIISVDYESLVSNPELEIRTLLKRLGLEYQSACVDFHLNDNASDTASFVQVREKAHTRSVGKWQHWSAQLKPLADALRAAGIDV